MTKRSLLAVLVTLAGTYTGVYAQSLGPVGRGGVVGGGPTPATKPLTATAPAPRPVLNLPPPITIPSPTSFAAEPADEIERPEFQSKVHPIAKNITFATAMMIQRAPDGSMIGVTSAVNAAVGAGTRQGKESKAVFVTKQAKVGPQMQTSFDEAIRAVQVRYPQWEPGRIDFSFDDKYTPHDGGSAGTCFAALLLSSLEGFSVDPKCAVTGDITVAWQVKQIGGLTAKLRGAVAAGCLYAGVPKENVDDVNDLALIYGDSALRDIQVFSLDTLQDAVSVMRTDRSPRLVAAMKAFDDLKPRLKLGKPALEDKITQRLLGEILALAPNHESARILMEMGKGTAPTKVTVRYAMEQVEIIFDPYFEIILGLTPLNRNSVNSLTTTARKQLNDLVPIAPPEMLAALRDLRAVVETTNNLAMNGGKPEALTDKFRVFLEDMRALGKNKDFIEKYTRGK